MADDGLREGILGLIKILDKAIAMEHNALVFYRNTAERTDSAKGRKMFEWLIGFEANHEEKLRIKKDELLNHPALEGLTPPPSEEDPLLSEATKSPDLPPKPSDVDVLWVAIENEQRAYAFYNRKFTHAGEEHLKTMFETMASEEDKHIRVLTEMRRHIQIEGIWADLEAIE